MGVEGEKGEVERIREAGGEGWRRVGGVRKGHRDVLLWMRLCRPMKGCNMGVSHDDSTKVTNIH